MRSVILCMVFALPIVFTSTPVDARDFLSDSSESADALPAALVRGAQEAYSVNMRGLDALEQGNLDSAAKYFSKAQAMLPLYSDAQNNMGVVHFRRGNITQASMIWKSVIDGDPAYSISYYNLGVVAFEEKKYGESASLFSKAINLNKRFVEAYIMLGRVELMTGRKHDALEHFKAANKIAPDRPDSWQFLAYGFIQDNDTNAAQSVLSKHQDNAEALKMLGQIASSRKDHAAASKLYTDAAARSGNPEQLLELAVSQLDGHNCKGALATLKLYGEKAAAQSADAFLYSGIAAKECGDIAAARSSFEKGLSRYPNDQILRYNLGQIYFHEKQYDQAESMWNSIADSLDDPSLSYLRGLNARRKGNLDLAETYVRKALKRDERPEFLDLLGTILYAKGKKDEATSSFKKALRLDPNLRSAQLNLALMTQSRDDLERAASELEKSVASCRNKCQDLVLQLSILYYHQAETGKAAKLLDGLADGEKTEKIFRHLALYFRDLHEWDKAIKTLEKAKTFFVLDIQTEYELAEDYLLSGNNQKAADALSALLGKWDQNPWRIYYQLGYACMEMKEFDKAKGYLQQSLKKKPDNLAAQGLMAYILNSQGDVTQARTIWEKTLKEDPSNFTLLINMGLSLEKENKFEEALGYYQKAHLLKPVDNGLQINIGNAYSGMEKTYEAMKAYSLALNSPKRDCAAYDIFLLSQKTKNRDKALDMMLILEREFPSSAYARRAQADMALSQKDTASALAKLEGLVDKDPADWLALARIHAMKKNASRASQCLDKVPSDPIWEKEKTSVKAQMDFLSGNFMGAFNQWKSLSDTGFTMQYNMALAAYYGKNYGDAFAIAEKIVGKVKGEERADIIRLAGNSAIGQKQWKKARQYYQQLEDVKARDPLVHYNLAVICYNLGSMDESWSYYQKARQLDPTLESKDIEKRYQSLHTASGGALSLMDSSDTWYNDAVALQNDGKDSAAELTYKKILDKDPTYYRAWNNLGAIYSGRAELGQAEQCYLKSIEKQHDIPEAYANLVNIYVAMENYKDAQRWLLKGKGHNPDSELLKDLETKVKGLAKKKK